MKKQLVVVVTFWATACVVVFVMAVAHEVPGENVGHLHGDELTEEDLLGPDGRPFSGDESIYAHPASPAFLAGSDGLDIGPTRASVPDDTVVLIVGNVSFTIRELATLKSFASAYVEHVDSETRW